MMGTRICLIGGSGFVGRAIVRQATRHGYAVTVACRHPERARDLRIEGVRLVRADIADGRGLDEAVADADIVVNLVGLLFERGRQNFAAVHVQGTERVLAACKRAGIAQYLHMSALGAGHVPASRYARSKAEAEERVRQSGLAWTIFRPSVIYGQGDSFLHRFKAMSRAPVLPIVGGDTRFQPVWVDDVARAFRLAIGNRHVHGQTYELGGPKAYTLRQIVAMLLAALGRKRLIVNLPFPVASLIAALGRLLPNPPLTGDQIALLKRDNTIDGDPFPALFGPPASLEAMLPALTAPDLASRQQQQLDARRTHYLNRR
jgi:NADH dehydrogenase